MNTCLECRHFVIKGPGERRGYCHALPPTVFSGGFNARPDVKDNDRSCGLFNERPADQPAEVKIKQQLETPGQALKAARQGRGK